MSCPEDHPFASGSGALCSKNFKRTNNLSSNALCDGDFLKFDDPPECCHQCVPCPKPFAKCYDRPYSHRFCPADSRAMRGGGDVGYIVFKSMYRKIEETSKFCHENYNGRLPRTLSQTAFNMFPVFHGSITFWISLETLGISPCDNNACVNKTSVRWEDGTMLKSTGDVLLRMGGKPNLCATIYANPLTTPSARVSSTPCSGHNAVVCEVFCSNQAPKYCPTSHQFAANNGQTCCNDFRRKFDIDSYPICDGTDLLVTDPKECCLDFIPCPFPEFGCQDAPRSKKFCPTKPDFERSSDHAFSKNDVRRNFGEAKTFCAYEENGDLPIVKSAFDLGTFDPALESRHAFFVGATYVSGIACTGLADCGSPPVNFTWSDGSRGELLDGYEFQFTPTYLSGLRFIPEMKLIVSHSKNSPLTTICQTPCSQVASYCPRSYPYATGLGGWCSKASWKLNDESVSSACDGSKLSFADSPDCCTNCTRCPGNYTSCINNQFFESYCPVHPNLTRFGLTGFIHLSNLGKVNKSSAVQACSSIGGRLPLIKSGFIMSGILDFLFSISYPALSSFWIGLESPVGASCVNADCTNSDAVFWSDGSSFTDFPSMYFQTNDNQCYVVKNKVFIGTNCADLMDTICEFVCDEFT